MGRIKALILAIVLVWPGAVFSNELPISIIQHVDQVEALIQEYVSDGNAEMPDQDWFDEKYAYYTALNVAWAHGDEDAVEHFIQELMHLYAEVLDDAGIEPSKQDL